MPCVFPVIGLKIMGFVQQAGSDRKKIALHGVTFALGVLASFGVLSGVLFAARAAAGGGADAIGWGYQLQNPWVVLTLMLLMFVLALNMFGIFELGTSATSLGGSLQSKHGLAGSFFSGVLATVVATPCSAPFLGVAIGAAIALPAFQFFTAFAVMAAGLALPYLILSVFPHLIDLLPRPGAWMKSFKQAMYGRVPAVRHRRLPAVGVCGPDRPGKPAGSGLRAQFHRGGRMGSRKVEPAAPQAGNPGDRAGSNRPVRRRWLLPRQTPAALRHHLGTVVQSAGQGPA